MGLGHNDPWVESPCDLNRYGVKGHLGVNDLWFKFLQKRSLYPHTLMYSQARLVVRDRHLVCLGMLSTMVNHRFVNWQHSLTMVEVSSQAWSTMVDNALPS